MYLVLLMKMLFASTFTMGKAVLQYLNPIFFTGLRMTFGGIILLSWLYFFKKQRFFIKKEHILLFLQITIFHIYMAFVFKFWALKYLSSFKTAFFYNLSPFIAAIFAYFFLAEKMSLKKWIGLLVGFSGILLVLVNDQSPQEAGKSAFFFISWPEISILVAVVSTVYGWVVFKKLVNVGGYSSLMINGFGMLSAGILAFITSFFVEGSCCCNGQSFFAMSATDLFASLGYTLLLIILTNIIGYNLYGYLLKKYSVTFLSFAGTLTPFFAAFFGNVFLGEVPSATFFISSIIVVIGLYIFYVDDKKTDDKKLADLLPCDE
jgi:drug/metabolite transporter (DMT)-like permease